MNINKPLCALLLAFSLSSPLWADQALIDKANAAFNRKDYKTANALIDKHLANNPNDDQALYAKSIILDKMGFYAKALTKLEDVLLISPKNHNAVTSYGNILQREVYRLINKGQFDEALALVERGLKTIPPKAPNRDAGLSNIYFAKGVVYFERWCQNDNAQDHKEFLDAWKQSADLQPISATSDLLAGIAAFEGYDYQRALEKFNSARTLRKGNRYATLWIGLADAALGENDAALREFTSLKDIYDQNPSLHLYIANIYKAQGKYSEAEEEYKAALALKPNDLRIYSSLKDLYLASGDINAGIREFGGSASASFADGYRYGTFLHEAGLTDQALEQYEAMSQMSLSPNQQAAVNLEKAIIYLENGQDNKASSIFGKEDENLIKSSHSPRYCIFKAYTESQADAREKQARKALTYSGPDSMWLHAEAFRAWAKLEMSRKENLRAMELIYQAWKRTSPASEIKSTLEAMFEDARKGALNSAQADLKALAPIRDSDPFKYREKSEYLNKCISAAESASLGNAGAMLLGSKNASSSMLLPEDVSIGLAHAVMTPDSSWLRSASVWE